MKTLNKSTLKIAVISKEWVEEYNQQEEDDTHVCTLLASADTPVAQVLAYSKAHAQELMTALNASFSKAQPEIGFTNIIEQVKDIDPKRCINESEYYVTYNQTKQP